MKRAFIRRQQRLHAQSGMSLIELLIAVVVMAVGFAGLLIMIMNSIATNGRNSRDSTGTILAQQVLEQISTQPANGGIMLTMTDCASPANTFTIAPVAGGPPVRSDGSIDFTAAKMANYHMDYVVCGTNGRQATYDVRWNVTKLDTMTALVTVSARPATGGPAILSPKPVTLRTIIGS